MTDPPASAQSSFDRSYYDRLYPTRRFLIRGDRPLLYRTVLRELRRLASGRLLDVGCGEGQFLRRAGKDFDAFGIEISQAGALAAQRVSSADVRVGSATALPYADREFDVITCFDVVEHLPDPSRFFFEAARVLRLGGVLFFSTPNPLSLGHRVKGSASTIYTDTTHVSVHPPDTWRRMCADHGFDVIRDGTDTLWDPPYTRAVPLRLQQAILGLFTYAIRATLLMLPWSLGENYLCLARRGPTAMDA